MKKVLVPIADGTEELEAVTIVDVLRRAEIDVTVASVEDALEVRASRGVGLVADTRIQDCMSDTWDMIVLPGGGPGAAALSDCEPLVNLLRKQLDSSGWIGAICAAPAVVLGRHGLIDEFEATCYPGFQDELRGQVRVLHSDTVVRDRNLITSQGPGTAMAFAVTLVEALSGKEVATRVADALLHAPG